MTIEATLALPTNRHKKLRRNSSGYLSWQDEPRIFVDDYGALGDGSTNDVLAIWDAVDAAHTLASTINKMVIVELNGDKNYAVGQRVASSQVGGGIWLPRGVSLEGNGAAITVLSNSAFVHFKTPLSTYGTRTALGSATASTAITANVAVNATQYTVTSTTGFAAGDEVMVRLNNNADDSAEVKDAFFAKVASVDSATLITLDRPSPVACTVATTAAANKKISLLHEPIEGSFVRNLRLINTLTGNAESGINLGYTRNVIVENITGEHVGAGIVLGGYIEGLIARNLRVRKCDAQNGHTAKGRALNLWNSKNCSVCGLYAENFEGSAVMLESYCRGIAIDGLHLVNNHATRANSTTGLLFVSQNSDVTFGDVIIEGTGGTPVCDSGGTTATVTWAGEVAINTASVVKGSLSLSNILGTLRIGATTYTDIRRFSKKIWLKASTDITYTLPTGLYRYAHLYASATTGITNLYLYAGAVASSDLVGSLVAGTTVNINSVGAYGTDYPFSQNTAHTIRIITGSGIVDGTCLVIDVEYFAAGNDDGIKAISQDETPMALAYTPTNVTPDRAFDADTVLVAELADVVGTLIQDLKTRGVLQ